MLNSDFNVLWRSLAVEPLGGVRQYWSTLRVREDIGNNIDSGEKYKASPYLYTISLMLCDESRPCDCDYHVSIMWPKV